MTSVWQALMDLSKSCVCICALQIYVFAGLPALHLSNPAVCICTQVISTLVLEQRWISSKTIFVFLKSNHLHFWRVHDFTFSQVFMNQNFEPIPPGHLTDTHSDWERPENAKLDAQFNPQNAQMIIEAFWGFNCAYNFAFLMPFLFWEGICTMPRCNRLKILVPKHQWKSRIRPLQLISATKRYVTLFLGHPVDDGMITVVPITWFSYCSKLHISSGKRRYA